MFFCDADPRLQPRDGATELATFACAPPTDGGPQPYTHLSDHYGISTTLRVMNDVCWHHSQVRDRGNQPGHGHALGRTLPLPLTLQAQPYRPGLDVTWT